MTTTLVVSDHTVRLDLFRDVIKRLAAMRDDDVFIVLCKVGRPALRRPWQAGRFWEVAHARLDSMLDELAAVGFVADGIVSGQDPLRTAAELLETTQPRCLVMALARTPRGRSMTRFERVLADRMRATGLPLETIWVR